MWCPYCLKSMVFGAVGCSIVMPWWRFRRGYCDQLGFCCLNSVLKTRFLESLTCHCADVKAYGAFVRENWFWCPLLFLYVMVQVCSLWDSLHESSLHTFTHLSGNCPWDWHNQIYYGLCNTTIRPSSSLHTGVWGGPRFKAMATSSCFSWTAGALQVAKLESSHASS